MLKGQYAIVVMFRDHPEVLIGARNDAPLVVGVGEREMFLASDVLAFISRTDRAVFLDNMEVVEVTGEGIQGLQHGRGRGREEADAAGLGALGPLEAGLRPLHAQGDPRAAGDRAAGDLSGPQPSSTPFVRAIKGAGSVLLTASGSSYHAAMLLKDRLNREAMVRCDAVLAGEFEDTGSLRGRRGPWSSRSARAGRRRTSSTRSRWPGRRGAKVISVVNAAGSSLARESDEVLLLNCGPEVGVAATKSFTAQVMVGNVIADAVIGRNTVGDPRRWAGSSRRRSSRRTRSGR